MLKRFLDGLMTAVALIFIIPTFLVLLTWNAIPGDNLYTLKTGLEDATLILLSGTPLVPKVSIQFTNRRLGEASKLLDAKGSTVGYSLLVAEARQTQNYLVSQNDKVDTATFIQNINQYKIQIEQQRARAAALAKATGKKLPTTLTNPTPVPSGQVVIINVPTQEIITQETPEQQAENLNNAENELNQIQNQLQEQQSALTPEPSSTPAPTEAPTPTPAPTQGFSGQGFGGGQGGGRGHNDQQNTASPAPTQSPTSSGNNFNFFNH